MADQNTIFVTVRNRQGLAFEGEIKSVTSFNKLGRFDVLAQHANFITLIKDRVMLGKKDGKFMEIPFSTGVMMVEGNKVEVFLGVGKL